MIQSDRTLQVIGMARTPEVEDRREVILTADLQEKGLEGIPHSKAMDLHQVSGQDQVLVITGLLNRTGMGLLVTIRVIDRKL
jgi:hypothetical protein